MGLYDRDYTQEGFQSQFRGAPQMRTAFPKLTPVVKWLLIINIGVFLMAIIIRPFGIFIYEWFQLDATSVPRAIQLWRLITYQFLHAPGFIIHILFNMLGLFFLGPTLERHWGSKKFLIFYLGCGVAGALFYFFLVVVRVMPAGEMIGASGAILGMLAACAILFPHFVVFFFLFPVPIRVAALILTLLYVANLFAGGSNAGGDAAHLGGMAAGAVYVFSEGRLSKLKLRLRPGASRWEREMAARRKLRIEVDRILQKVHDSGVHSLTSKERRTLRRATKAEQMRNRL